MKRPALRRQWRRVRRRLMYVDLGGRQRTAQRWWQKPAPFMGWLVYLGMAHATPRTMACVVVGLLPTAGLLVAGIDNAVTLFGFALACLMLSDMVLGFVTRPRVTVVCRLPARVARGAEVALCYSLYNAGRWAARDVAVDTLRGYERRTLKQRSPPALSQLPPGTVERLEGLLTIRRRGRFNLPPLRVDSTFPLGFWRWGRTDWSVTRTLNVYPNYRALDHFEMPMGVRQRLDSAPARRLARSALEFHACREFRDGDSLRHVHPRSSARLGIPVVKEFLSEGEGRTAVLTDTWRTSRLARLDWVEDEPVEAALTLTAAVVEALARTDRVLELLVAGPGVFRFESAGRLGFFPEVLDILAEVDPCDDDPLSSLAPELLSEIRSIQSVCLILGRWDARRVRLVAELEAASVGLKVVVTTGDAIRPERLPAAVVWVSCRDVLRGKVVAL